MRRDRAAAPAARHAPDRVAGRGRSRVSPRAGRAASCCCGTPASRSSGLVELYAPEGARRTSTTRRHRRVGEQVAGGGAVGRPQARLRLASTRPQRRAILEQLRIPFEVVAPDVRRGRPSGMDPAELVLATPRGRRAPSTPTGITLGVDTTVVLDGRVYGKPADREDAGRMLSVLSGRTHDVVSGLCLARPRHRGHRARDDRRDISHLSHDLSTAYLESGEWEGRAGATRFRGSEADSSSGSRATT